MGEPRAPHSGKLQRCGLQAFRVVISNLTSHLQEEDP